MGFIHLPSENQVFNSQVFPNTVGYSGSNLVITCLNSICQLSIYTISKTYIKNNIILPKGPNFFMVNIKNNGEGLTIKNFTDSASKTNDNHIYFIDFHEVNVTNTDVSSSLIRFYINEFFNQYPYMFNIHILESHNDSSIHFGLLGIDNFSSVYSKYSPNSNKGSTFKVKCLVSDDCLVDVYSYDGSVVQSGVRVFFNNPSLLKLVSLLR